MNKIGLIDADLLDNGTRHPNLVLMKLSGYFKAQGSKVSLIFNDLKEVYNYDEIYISKVFNFTKIDKWLLELPNVKIGGTGFYEDGGENLPDEIEHHMPDYDLYTEYVDKQIELGKKESNYSDYLDYSIGFMSRGCFRKCAFCVNKKYDRAFFHAHLNEFYDESRKSIYLWDDNFLACNKWSEILDELEATNRSFQFRQGIDIRLLTDKKAERLAKVKYHGDFIFAFDHVEESELISKKLEIWRRHTSRTTKLYVLCAYDSQDHVDIINVFKRIKILMKYGCLPYIMRYEDYNTSKYKGLYVQLARWCNQPQFFKKKSFREFCVTNQEYHSNKSTNCAAYQAMLDFEAKHPDIAKKYFDLKFDNENIYTISYGFGRKYSHKLSCDICSKDQKTWLDAYHGILTKEEIVSNYFSQEMDLQCLAYKTSKCIEVNSNEIAKWFCNILKDLSVDDIWRIIANSKIYDDISQANIPQYSNFSDGSIQALRTVKQYPDGIGFADFGYQFKNAKAKNAGAQRKYGENHAKLASLLDLAVINNVGNTVLVSISVLGKGLYQLTDDDKKQIIPKLILRIPIIQKMLFDASNNEINIRDYMSVLSTSTLNRRESNVWTLIEILRENADGEVIQNLSNINRG